MQSGHKCHLKGRVRNHCVYRKLKTVVQACFGFSTIVSISFTHDWCMYFVCLMHVE